MSSRGGGWYIRVRRYVRKAAHRRDLRRMRHYARETLSFVCRLRYAD